MLKPHGKKLLVKVEERVKSSLLIVEDQSPIKEAKVYGSGIDGVAIGDKVLVHMGGAMDITEAGLALKLIDEAHVLGVFEGA